MSAAKGGQGPENVDLLAPWRAVGRLDEADAAALERMLADDPDLAARLEAAAEERDATVELNEALPGPSSAVRERLFERIEAHEAARAPRAAGVLRWLAERLSALSPATLAWGATAAALVIAAQAGLIAVRGLGGAGEETTYQTASENESTEASPTALVMFEPGATAAQITEALAAAGAEVVGGPKPGGVFVVRYADEKALETLTGREGVVKLATPSTR